MWTWLTFGTRNPIYALTTPATPLNDAHPAGFLLPQAKPTFTKPALSVADQIALLAGRGLVVPDTVLARRWLEAIGYFRLSGYMLPFQRGGRGPDRHMFRPGTTFGTILDLYNFDRHLRLATMDAVERVEVGFRAAITDTMAVAYGPHWFLDPARFAPHADHGRLLTKIQEDIGHDPRDAHRRDTAIRHYYAAYGAPPLPPSWMVFEVLSFGTVSQTFRLLERRSKRRIAGRLGVPDVVLDSWAHAISYTRNLCAHHARLWNRVFTIKPMVARAYQADLMPNTTFYAQAVAIQGLLRSLPAGQDWPTRLDSLFVAHPHIRPLDLGFPTGWRSRPAWR